MDNINRTFVTSLTKPDSSYMTAVIEQLDELERVDQSVVREQILQQVVARTKVDLTMAQIIVALLERGYSVPFIHAYKRDITVSFRHIAFFEVLNLRRLLPN